LAIVPRFLTRSSFVMPMPVSVTCRTWLSLSACRQRQRHIYLFTCNKII